MALVDFFAFCPCFFRALGQSRIPCARLRPSLGMLAPGIEGLSIRLGRLLLQLSFGSSGFVKEHKTQTLKEEKTMKSDQAKKLTEDALKELSAALEAGKSEELTRHLATMARFHKYSFRNVLLIITQCPDATRVAGFQTWKQLGRWVRKGEKGLAVIAPIVLKRDDESTQADDSLIRFKVAHVFDISQTEGDPLPELAEATGDPGTYTDRLRGFVTSRGITLNYLPDLGGPLGYSANGKITLRENLSPAEEFTTLVHELAHEMLHWDQDRPDSKKVRETEAEAVAFVVAHAVGLQTLNASSDYIQLYSGEVETLAQSLERVQKVAATILEAIHSE